MASTPTRFGQFARALRELSRVPARVASASAEDIGKLMRRGFRAGVDPYLRAYAPLTVGSLRRGRTPPPLRTYARHVRAEALRGAGISVRVEHPQVGFHQTGTLHMAQRIVLPDGPVPAGWSAAIRKHIEREVRRGLGR